MIKNIVILIFIAFNNLYGQTSNRKLVVLTKGYEILIKDISSSDSIIVHNLPKDKYWEIGSLNKIGQIISIKLYPGDEYLSFNFNNTLLEKEVIFDLESKKLIGVNSCLILKDDVGIYLIRESDSLQTKLNIEYINERYDIVPNFYSLNGNIVSAIDSSTILKANKENNIVCGYYSPNFNKAEGKIICEYYCSKHKGKKNISNSELVEISLDTKVPNNLGICGSNPKYSKDGSAIVYHDFKGVLNVYILDGTQNYKFENFKQAFWLD